MAEALADNYQWESDEADWESDEALAGESDESVEDIGERTPKNGAAPVRAYAMNPDAVASAPLDTELPRAAVGRRHLSLRSAAIAASLARSTSISAIATSDSSRAPMFCRRSAVCNAVDVSFT